MPDPPKKPDSRFPAGRSASPEHRWRPGESGNPDGYSRGRRIADALVKVLEERGLINDLVLVWIAKAKGDVEFLERAHLKPELAWFMALVDRVDGPIASPRDQADVHVSVSQSIDPAAALRILEAADPDVLPRLDADPDPGPGPPAAAKPPRAPAKEARRKKGRAGR